MDNQLMKNKYEVFVESEFAPLRKVVLTQSEFAFPSVPLSDKDRSFLLPEMQQLFELGNGKDFAEAFPAQQAQWEQERFNFEKVLTKYEIEVVKPRLLTEEEKLMNALHGYSNFFVRDPFFTVGSFVIEGSLRFLHRRFEILPVRPVLREHVMLADCTYIAAPQPEISAMDDETLGNSPFIEGGDVLVLGKHVFIGQSGLASNEFGARWLEKLLKSDHYTVELIRLHPTILHLDCAISFVREGLMIVCEEAFLDGIPPIFDDWDKIYVSLEDCSRLITNGLPISPSVYVMDPEFEALGNRIKEKGIHVEYIDFQISRRFGGSFRCSTQPLIRKF